MKVTPADPPCARCGKPKSAHAGQWFATEGTLYCVSGGADSFRRRIEDMPRLGHAPHPDVPLGSYVNIKNKERYEVIGGTFLADGDDDLVFVLYQSVAHGYLAHRLTPAGFLAKFEPFEARKQV